MLPQAQDSSQAADPSSPGEGPRPAWEVARDLRWSMAKGLLFDPISWLGTLAMGWGLSRLGGLDAGTGLVVTLAVTTWLADGLLFGSKDNELLRTQPLGPSGLLRVRRAEVGWMLQPVRVILLVAVAGWQGGWTALVCWLAAGFLPGLGVRLAIALRQRYGQRGSLALAPPALLALFTPIPGSWEVAVLAGGVAFLLGRGTGDPARFEAVASRAHTASPRERGRLWRGLGFLLPVPARLRSRLVRDLVLLLRGQDLRGATLILLSPLSWLLLSDELAVLKRPELVGWRTLTCAALGGAAIAYAMGPGIQLLRGRVMPWERVSQRPGHSALVAALLYALIFALLHGLGTLATLYFAAGGRFSDQAATMLLPVLILELAMAHYVVVFTMTASSGQRIHGEGTLVLALPVVAIAVAVGAWFAPWIALLYFVLTGGMVAQAIRRYDRVEVLW